MQLTTFKKKKKTFASYLFTLFFSLSVHSKNDINDEY